MKKVFRFDGLECPNCAKKLEEAIRPLDGVISFSVNYITGKLTLEAEDARFDELLSAVSEAGKRVKPAFCIRT